MNGIPMEHGLLVAAALFCLGLCGVLMRRNLLFILMSVPFILLNDWYTERLRKRELSGGTV